ncbi:helix-turn-helix domain-containing protein [Priestia megaterium]|uniref:helix-turn-helix domain-containing protein n=1 Tax=Priestia megaterium TaxID=1404 RepID=UPI0010AC775C|nr:helix-turn-helix domain-containing protein [Priestia megaterium]TJZ40065.1 helix-turn-helix domain-containing protein [Priestia megaterium]
MNKLTITVKEAAEYIGVSKDLIYSLVREKRIPHIRVGQRILFRKQTIDQWFSIQEAKKNI